MIREFWTKQGRSARVGLAAGACVIVAGTVALAFWLLTPDYEVLFADLAPQDAATVVAELERQKVPYSLSERGPEGGVTVLVDRKDVHRTRLKVMGTNLQLHGAVGFELFNNSDFGMTEFSQRINYQRALQGELTRTILSLTEIKDARVLLALPEQSLFRQSSAQGKASVTLTLKPGRVLRQDQVIGIQRLVAAAVPGMTVDEVTLVDQSGVALSKATGEGDITAGSGRFDLKRDTERYLAGKAGEILDNAFGPGQALASVDVTLDMNRVQTTTEDVLAAPEKEGKTPTGIVVRERDTTREIGGASSAQDPDGGAASGSTQREVEYAVGRRVEQVIRQPGSIARLHVVAVVKRPLNAEQREQITRMVGASVGALAERGDSIVVQSMDAVAAVEAVAGPPGSGMGEQGAPEPKHTSPAVSTPWHSAASNPIAVGAVMTLFVAATSFWLGRRGLRGDSGDGGDPGIGPGNAGEGLSEEAREIALARVQTWLKNGGEAHRARGGLS